MKVICNMMLVALSGGWLVSCNVTASHPVSGLAQSDPVPESWLGTWQVEQVLGSASGQPTSVKIEQYGDEPIQITLKEGDQTLVQSVSLAEVGGRRILSATGDEGIWTIFAVESAANGAELFLREPDSQVIKSDVEQGLVTGEVISIGRDNQIVNLKASSEELRSYLATRSTVFGSIIAVLRKKPEEN